MRFIHYHGLSLPFRGTLVRRGNVPSRFSVSYRDDYRVRDVNHFAPILQRAATVFAIAPACDARHIRPILLSIGWCRQRSAVAQRTIDNERQLRENVFIPVCKTPTIVPLSRFFSFLNHRLTFFLLGRYSAAFSPSFPQCRRSAMAVGCTVGPWINGPSVVVLCSHKATASRRR